MSAPTYVTKYCDAKHRESEYNGRPAVGQKPPKSAASQIPGTPHSLNLTLNAWVEERAARDRDMRKEVAVQSFNSKYQARVERRGKRQE